MINFHDLRPGEIYPTFFREGSKYTYQGFSVACLRLSKKEKIGILVRDKDQVRVYVCEDMVITPDDKLGTILVASNPLEVQFSREDRQKANLFLKRRKL